MAEADKGANRYVDALFVEEPLRHQVWGTYFLQEMEKPAKENGASMILTNAGSRNVDSFIKNGCLIRGELRDVPKDRNCCELCKKI